MKIVVSKDYLTHKEFIETIPAQIEQIKGSALYHGRNELWRLEHENTTFVVKRFKRADKQQQVIYTYFRSTKAARAFLLAEEFRRRGVSTPHEVAYIEQSENGLFTNGYFISEEVKGRCVFLDLITHGTINELLSDAVIRFIVHAHSKGVLHGDLNMANILYEQLADGSFSFNMVDINSSFCTEGWPSDEQCLRNIIRMTPNQVLFEYLVRRYSVQRGWDTEEALREVLFLLHQSKSRRKNYHTSRIEE